jgi:hypothetical protein
MCRLCDIFEKNMVHLSLSDVKCIYQLGCRPKKCDYKGTNEIYENSTPLCSFKKIE